MFFWNIYLDKHLDRACGLSLTTPHKIFFLSASENLRRHLTKVIFKFLAGTPKLQLFLFMTYSNVKHSAFSMRTESLFSLVLIRNDKWSTKILIVVRHHAKVPTTSYIEWQPNSGIKCIFQQLSWTSTYSTKYQNFVQKPICNTGNQDFHYLTRYPLTLFS